MYPFPGWIIALSHGSARAELKQPFLGCFRMQKFQRCGEPLSMQRKIPLLGRESQPNVFCLLKFCSEKIMFTDSTIVFFHHQIHYLGIVVFTKNPSIEHAILGTSPCLGLKLRKHENVFFDVQTSPRMGLKKQHVTRNI